VVQERNYIRRAGRCWRWVDRTVVSNRGAARRTLGCHWQYL